MNAGGAVYVTTNSSVHFEAGGWLDGNNAVQQGGAVCLGDSAVLSMVGVTVSSNTADLFVGGAISAGNGSQVLIGGIYGASATIVVRNNSRVADNEAKVDGGGVCVVGYGTLEMDASSITGNRAAGDGGGIAVSTGSEAALRNGTVVERNSGGDGGGLAVSAGRVSMMDAIVRVNIAHGSAAGVLVDSGAEVVVEGSHFELHPGSALKVVGEAQAMVRSTIFAQNNGTSGGGLWADSSTTVRLDGCSFENNVAEAGSGGGFYSAGNLTLIESLCVGNTAQEGGSAFLQFTLPSQVAEATVTPTAAELMTDDTGRLVYSWGHCDSHWQTVINESLEAQIAAATAKLAASDTGGGATKTAEQLLERRRKLAYVPEAKANPFPRRPASLTSRMPQLYDLHGNKTYDVLAKKSNSSMKFESVVLGPSMSYLYDVVTQRKIAELYVAFGTVQQCDSDGRYDAERDALAGTTTDTVECVCSRLCQSVYLAVPAARLYLRELYFVLAEKRSWGSKVKISRAAKSDVKWWSRLPVMSKWNGRRIWRPATRAKLHTDSSMTAWGGVINLKHAAIGFWSDEMRSWHITHLELEAVFKTVQAFLRELEGKVLPRYYAAWRDPLCEGMDSLTYDRRGENNWVNPPWALLDEVAHKLREEGAAATVVAPYWPGLPVSYFAAQLKSYSVTSKTPKVTVGTRLEIFWVDDDKFYPGSVKSFNKDGTAHVVYDDGDEETLNLSEEKFNILHSAGVYKQNSETAEVLNENMERGGDYKENKCGGDYKENKRGGDTQNFFTRSLCGRWRGELGQSAFTDLAIQMQRRSLLNSTLSNYGPKAERFVYFCQHQHRQWLPASEATVLLYLASLLEAGNIKSTSLQPYLSAINNYHEDLSLTGPAKGRAVTRAVKGMATIQAEAAVMEESIETQSTWLPARHVRRVHEAALQLSPRSSAHLQLLRAFSYVVIAFITFGRPDTGTSLSRVHVQHDDEELSVVLLREKERRHHRVKRRLCIPWNGVPLLRDLVPHWEAHRDAAWSRTSRTQPDGYWLLPEDPKSYKASVANDWISWALTHQEPD
eukprot:gene288-biopygen202